MVLTESMLADVQRLPEQLFRTRHVATNLEKVCQMIKTRRKLRVVFPECHPSHFEGLPKQGFRRVELSLLIEQETQIAEGRGVVGVALPQFLAPHFDKLGGNS